MSETTKKQPYKYTSKNISYSNVYQSGNQICGGGVDLYMIPPKNALTIENLKTRLRVQFPSSVPVGNRVLKRYGITIGTGSLFIEDRDRTRLLDVNIAADANRIIDFTFDLTPFLKKTAVAYREQLLDIGDLDLDCMYITAEFIDDISNPENVGGTIEIWKADALYTTVGIQ